MASKVEIGNKYFMLTIVKSAGFHYSLSGNKYEQVLCRCDCGKERIVGLSSVTSGLIKSCGCVTFYCGKVFSRQGMTHNKLRHLWNRIRYRCTNSKHPDYPDYGGRGIKVYDDWLYNSFAFIVYIQALPFYGETGRTLDRINNDGNYEPGNLRWADGSTQAFNRRIKKTNKCGYTGICYNKEKKKYTSVVSVSGKQIYLGAYLTIQEALSVRNNFIIDNNITNQKIQESK